jgi:cyclin-dependent kinase-like
MFYKNPIYDGKELSHVSKPESLERKYLGKLGPTAIDFMKGLLQLDPKKRLNSETVFKHKYFACFMKDEQKNEKLKENKINENIQKDRNNNKENIAKESQKKEIKSNKEIIEIKEAM